MTPRTEIRGDRVVKVQSPDAAALELVKTGFGCAIGKRSGLFSVPGVISSDANGGRIEFAFVPDIQPVRATLGAPGWENRLDAAAAALVEIHRALVLPEARPVPSLHSRNLRFLHGDYSPTNVQIDASGTLWILDWAAADWLGPLATVGQVSVDLAAFVLPLFWQRPGDPLAVPEPEARARRFLDAYSRRAAIDSDFSTIAGKLQRLRMPQAAQRLSRSGIVARIPMQARCWYFLQRYTAPG